MSESSPPKNPSPLESLFEGENLSDLPKPELKKIQLAPSATLLEMEKERQTSGLDRRIFTRIDVGDRKLDIKFGNGMQFARQYIENISMGGLFVKTDSKFEKGEIVPIDFNVPIAGGTKNFKLNGKVCRVAPDGVGLEFLDLSDDIRQDLERYVREILPEGSQAITPKAKLATIENLERLREQKAARMNKIREQALWILLFVALVVINLILARETLDISKQNQASTSGPVMVQLGQVSVNADSIHATEYKDHRLTFHLDSGEQVTVHEKDLKEEHLPPAIVYRIQLLRSIPPVQVPRVSKNAPGLSHLAR